MVVRDGHHPNAPHSISLWDQAAEAVSDLFLASPGKSGAARRRNAAAATAAEVRDEFERITSSSGGGVKGAAVGSSSGAGGIDPRALPTVLKQKSSLFRLMKKREWDQVRFRAESFPDEAKTWIVELGGDGTVQWKLLPLHQACEMQCPPSVVNALLKAFPPAAVIKDEGGELPIHFAFRSRFGRPPPSSSRAGAAGLEDPAASVVLALLSPIAGPASPSTPHSSSPSSSSDQHHTLQYNAELIRQSASIPNDAGRLALHLACRWGGPDMEPVVDALLAVYARGTNIPDAYGLLPLHCAVLDGNATPCIVESLLRVHPHSCDARDKWGRTPRDVARSGGGMAKRGEMGTGSGSATGSLALASDAASRTRILDALCCDPIHWSSTATARENEYLRKELQDIERDVHEAEDARSALESVRAEKDELSERVRAMEEELRTVRMGMTEAERRAEEEKGAAALAAEEKIENLKRAAVEEKSELEERIDMLEKKANTADALELVQTTLEQENVRLLIEVEDQSRRLVERNGRVKALEGEVERLRSDTELLRSEVENLRSENGRMSASLSEAEKLTGVVAERDGTIAVLTDDVQTLRRAQARLEDEVERLGSERLRLHDESRDRAALLAEVRDASDAAREENIRLRKRLDRLAEEANRLVLDRSRLADEAETCKALLSETRDAAEEAEIRNARLRTKADRIAEEAEKMRDEASALRAECVRLREDADVLGADVESLKRERDAIAEEAGRIKEERNAAFGRCEDLERKLERLSGIFRALERQRNRNLTETDDYLRKASSFIYGQEGESGSEGRSSLRPSAMAAGAGGAAKKVRVDQWRKPRGVAGGGSGVSKKSGAQY